MWKVEGVFQHLYFSYVPIDLVCIFVPKAKSKVSTRLFAKGFIHVMSYLTSEIDLQNPKDYPGQKKVKNTLGN